MHGSGEKTANMATTLGSAVISCETNGLRETGGKKIKKDPNKWAKDVGVLTEGSGCTNGQVGDGCGGDRQSFWSDSWAGGGTRY